MKPKHLVWVKKHLLLLRIILAATLLTQAVCFIVVGGWLWGGLLFLALTALLDLLWGNPFVSKREIVCPACGSKNVSSAAHREEILVPYGPSAEFVEIVHTCQDCLVEGDFSGNDDNSKRLRQAVQASHASEMRIMLSRLNKMGHTEMYIERALRLRPGATKKWKRGNGTDSDLALLRFVYTFPWLLAVSDGNFNEDVINQFIYERKTPDQQPEEDASGEERQNEKKDSQDSW